MSTNIPLQCQHCGRPIGGAAVYIGHLAYHEECTRGGPGLYEFKPLPMSPYRCAPAEPLTEADIRRIVREELANHPARSAVEG